MRRLTLSIVALALTACAASAPAPIVFGGGARANDADPLAAPPRERAPMSVRERAPMSVRERAPMSPRADTGPPAARPQPASPTPAEPAPNWAAGPGTPLSTWALRPEEAAPFDPAAPPRTHVVAPGDTLYALSVRYQIPLRPLIELNQLDAPFALSAGQTLRLPPPRLHHVRRGETLTSLARQYNIDARSLALLNRLAKPYAVRAGDTLALPALARGDTPEEATPESAAPTPPAPVTGPTRFAWPLIGTVLTRFGPQAGGRRSDGVDIAASEGADVKAAADGRVVYAGDDLAGYGNLMLVQHADGWVTAYAHCSGFAVREGDRVRQGQKLGQVGKTATGQSKLHFQLRRGGTPTDPLASLPSLPSL